MSQHYLVYSIIHNHELHLIFGEDDNSPGFSKNKRFETFKHLHELVNM